MIRTLDTRQLVVFHALVQTRSFTQAAQRMNLTQSAISHSVRNLEEHLGCQLAQRAGKRLIITREGEQLFEHARRIFYEMGEACRKIEERSDWDRGRLALGASATACEHFLPSILREFNECFPHCSLSVVPGDTPALLERIRSGDIDLAIIIEPEDLSGMEVTELFSDEMSLVASPAHAWAKAGKANLSQLSEERLILYNKTSQTYRIIQGVLEARGLARRNVLELGSMEAIKALVKTNFGISILADWIVEQEVNGRRLVRLSLGRQKIRRRWSVAHLRGKKLSITEETFIGIAESFAKARYSG